MKATIGDILNAANEVTNKAVADVFVNYSGHIKQLSIDFHKQGCLAGGNYNSVKFFLDDPEPGYAQKRIDTLYAWLIDMLPDQPEGSGDEVGA